MGPEKIVLEPEDLQCDFIFVCKDHVSSEVFFFQVGTPPEASFLEERESLRVPTGST